MKTMVEWARFQGSQWYDLDEVDLKHEYFNDLDAVYVIWRTDGKVVKVGSGMIRDRLQEHLKEKEIRKLRPLNVTWGIVMTTKHTDGVVRFLTEKLNPMLGGSVSAPEAVEVNLPW